MQFYKFWAKARHPEIRQIVCYGYSNESVEDAQRVAREITERVAQRWKSRDRGSYEYGAGAMREPVIERFTRASGDPVILSRNAYGALILNAPDVFIGDVDTPPALLGGLIGRLFGKKPATPEETVRATIRELVAERPGFHFRLYRTASGFRVFLVSQPVDPLSHESRQLMQRLNCDEIYAGLCQHQKCFRARLTPKPFRINMPRPPVRFPFLTSESQNKFEAWKERYEQRSTQFSACELVDEIGSGTMHADIESIVQLHDHYACTGNPLA